MDMESAECFVWPMCKRQSSTLQRSPRWFSHHGDFGWDHRWMCWLDFVRCELPSAARTANAGPSSAGTCGACMATKRFLCFPRRPGTPRRGSTVTAAAIAMAVSVQRYPCLRSDTAPHASSVFRIIPVGSCWGCLEAHRCSPFISCFSAFTHASVCMHA